MDISCQLSMTQVVLLNDDEWTTEIEFQFSSQEGGGCLGGRLVIPHEVDPQFRVTVTNNLGLPDEICRELLLAAYTALGQWTVDTGSDQFTEMSDFCRWLRAWFRPFDAEKLAWSVAHFLRQRPPSAMLPSPHQDALNAQWQVAISDDPRRNRGCARTLRVRLFSLPYGIEIGASVAEFDPYHGVVDELIANDCLLPSALIRSLIQQIYESCRPTDDPDGVVTWINLDYFVQTYFPDNAETVLSLIHRPIRTFCQ